MDSEEDPQLLEITALQSIYANDFITVPPPKAWKVCGPLYYPHNQQCWYGLLGCSKITRVYYTGSTSRSDPWVKDSFESESQVSHGPKVMHYRWRQCDSRFPKTYPRLACPTFAIEKPIKGLNDGQVAKLSHEINVEAQKLRGFEMVFSVRIVLGPLAPRFVTPVYKLWPCAFN